MKRLLALRFSLPTLLAAMAVVAVYTYANLVSHGPWGHREVGFPFAWYVRTDYGPPHHRYYWVSLAGNVLLGAATIVGIVFATELGIRRLDARNGRGRDSAVDALPNPTDGSDAAGDSEGRDE